VKNSTGRTNKTYLIGLIAALAFFLAGCTTPRLNPIESDWFDHSTRISTIETWKFRGKAALKGPELGQNMKVDWHQYGMRYDIQLKGPMGIGATRIRGHDDTIEQIAQGDDTINSAEIEIWLEQQLGGQLPLASMRYWLRGLPVPGTVITASTTDQGRLASLVQQQWTVELTEYRPVQAGIDIVQLPHRVKLSQGEYRARIHITRWLPGVDTP
jgi:outer membrane lipoprotein LolB